MEELLLEKMKTCSSFAEEMSSFAVDWGPKLKLLGLAWPSGTFKLIACLPGPTQRLLADKKSKTWISEFWDFPDLNILHV